MYPKIAQSVKDTLYNNNMACFSLLYGQGNTYNGKIISFKQGHQEHIKRNANGRVILQRIRYADNSVLEYRYDTKTQIYRLSVEN